MDKANKPVIMVPGDISLHFKIIRNGLEVGHREFKTIDEAMVGLQLLKNYITNVKAEQKPIPQEDEDGIQQEETKGTEPEEPISGKA